MIVSVQSALSYLKKEIPESDLKRKISAIESLIRDETNNNVLCTVKAGRHCR